MQIFTRTNVGVHGNRVPGHLESSVEQDVQNYIDEVNERAEEAIVQRHGILHMEDENISD